MFSMEKGFDDYIILRTERLKVPETPNLGGFPSPGPMAGPSGIPMAGPVAAAETVEVTTAPLTKAERDDLRRDPRTHAIATPMPLGLIEPKEVGAPRPAMAANAWGIEAVGAEGSSFTGAGETVAVLDTGIDPDHPVFEGVDLVRRNFTQEVPNDIHGHGTHCAGTIFGRDVDGMRIGVARGVDRALIGKVLGAGGGSSAQLVEAIRWAVQEGASVVSMSLGIDFPGFVKQLVDQVGLEIEPATSIALEQYRANINLFSRLSDLMRAQGVVGMGGLVIAAAGNESERPRYEIATAPPAAGTGILSVGALTRRNGAGHGVARFSNTECNLSAPGVDVISAAIGGGLVPMSGTSMATPHVAGVAMLWAERQRGLLGSVNLDILQADLLANADRSLINPGLQTEDVGVGLVRAPA